MSSIIIKGKYIKSDSEAIIPFKFSIDDDSLLQYANNSIYGSKIENNEMTDEDWESLIKDTARWMLHVGRANFNEFYSQDGKWNLDSEQIKKVKNMFESLPKNSSKKYKKKTKDIRREEYPGQKRTVPIGMPPKGFYYDPEVKEGKSSTKPRGASLNDAVKFYIENPERYGTPSHFDMENKVMEFDSGKKLSFDDVVKSYLEDSGNEKESDASDQWGKGGFWDSPVDVGDNPKGDFPSVQWLPRGQEDTTQVDPDAVYAYKDSDNLISKAESFLGLSHLDKVGAMVNKEVLEEAVYNYVKNLDESYWIEHWAEDYIDSYIEQYSDARGHMPSQNVIERVSEEVVDNSAEWWFEEFGDAAIDYFLADLGDVQSEDDLKETYPDIYEFYKKLQSEYQQSFSSKEEYIKKKAESDDVEPLSNKMMVDMIPMFTDSTEPDNHNCGNCNMRYTDKDGVQRCTVVAGEISYTKGTCNYMAPGPEASEEDSSEMKMDYGTAGYVEVPEKNIKINCSTCKYYDPEYSKNGKTYTYCKLWGGSVKPEQCCMAWDRDDVIVPEQESQKKTSEKSHLSEQQETQIASEWGVEYNSALKRYLEARDDGHPHDRALEYADEEMQKVGLPISTTKLSEIIDLYVK